MWETHIWSESESAGNEESVGTPKSKFSGVFTWLWATHQAEGVSGHREIKQHLWVEAKMYKHKITGEGKQSLLSISQQWVVWRHEWLNYSKVLCRSRDVKVFGQSIHKSAIKIIKKLLNSWLLVAAFKTDDINVCSSYNQIYRIALFPSSGLEVKSSICRKNIRNHNNA